MFSFSQKNQSKVANLMVFFAKTLLKVVNLLMALSEKSFERSHCRGCLGRKNVSTWWM